MGFKLPGSCLLKSPLLGINHFFYTRYVIPTKEKKPRKQKELGWSPAA